MTRTLWLILELSIAREVSFTHGNYKEFKSLVIKFGKHTYPISFLLILAVK